MIKEDNKAILEELYSPENPHVKYFLDKVNYNFWKKFILGIMGGVFAGLGYIGYNLLNGGSYNPETLEFTKHFPETGFFFGALIFPIGILMIIYLGGSLFTSNVLIVMGVFAKKVRKRMFLLDLVITLFGNILGGILMAILSFLASIYWSYSPETGLQINDIGWGVIYVADKKVSTEWWSNIFSGIICNMMVAGSIYAWVKIENKGQASLVVYFFIVVFAISGFQHVVANTYVFTEAALLYTIANIANDGLDINSIYGITEMQETFYVNTIPTIIGNFLGGFLIAWIYMFVEYENASRSFASKKSKIKILKSDRNSKMLGAADAKKIPPMGKSDLPANDNGDYLNCEIQEITTCDPNDPTKCETEQIITCPIEPNELEKNIKKVVPKKTTSPASKKKKM
ncbi:MAG: formate/nitrite transporter family protein [Mycoplasmoidaceae bacterium]